VVQIVKRCASRIAHVGFALTLIAGLAIGTAGFWLPPNQKEIQPADIIVVLSGGLERSLYAADLYHQGYAKAVWISRPADSPGTLNLADYGLVIPREEEIHRRILVKKSVAEKDIDFFGTHSMSTAEEARALQEKIGTGTKRIIIVTSPAHTLRARMIFGAALNGTNVAIQVVATPYEHFDRLWWRDQNSARMVVLECAKIFYYLAGGRFVSHPRSN
jgi:uncharacterized SAM-binding protein YcdF (DUF218 family)